MHLNETVLLHTADHIAQVTHWWEAVPVQVRGSQQLQQGFQQQQRPSEARANPPGSGRGELMPKTYFLDQE